MLQVYGHLKEVTEICAVRLWTAFYTFSTKDLLFLVSDLFEDEQILGIYECVCKLLKPKDTLRIHLWNQIFIVKVTDQKNVEKPWNHFVFL